MAPSAFCFCFCCFFFVSFFGHISNLVGNTLLISAVNSSSAGVFKFSYHRFAVRFFKKPNLPPPSHLCTFKSTDIFLLQCPGLTCIENSPPYTNHTAAPYLEVTAHLTPAKATAP